MKKLGHYENYIIKVGKILQDFYSLPEIPYDNNYDDLFAFNWCIAGAIKFKFNVCILHNSFITELDSHELNFGKLLNFKAFILKVLLHEIKHYIDYRILGAKKFSILSDDNTYGSKLENRANDFSNKNYRKAKLFLKECLK